MATLIGSGSTLLATYIPDLSDAANIQTALKQLYYGTTAGTLSQNVGIYGALYTLYTGDPTLSGNPTINGNLTVGGTLIVNGTTTTINSNTLTVDDKNIEIGSIAIRTALTATLSTGTAIVTITSSGGTTGLIPGQTVTKTSGTGAFGASPTILSVDSATQITLSVNNATAGAIVFSSGGATDLTADGGGITLKGATDKTILWDSANLNWTTSENWNIASGKTLKINNTTILDTNAPKSMATLMGYTSTATAAGTTTLTNTSSYYQQFTGVSTQTVVLPVTSTLITGWTFHIVNNSTLNLTVNSSGGNLVITVIPGTTAMVTCILTSGTTAASWEAGLTDFSTYTGSGNVVMSSSPTITSPTITSITGPTSIALDTTSTAVTKSITDNSTAVSTTAYVTNELTNLFSQMCFGNGQDGTYTLNASQAAVTGLFSKAGTVFILLRDAWFSDLNIASGYTLDPAGFTVYVSGTLTMNGANAFTHTAANGSGGTSGSSGSGANASTQGYQTVLAGTSGGSGGSTGVSGSPGGTAPTPTASLLFAGTYSQAVGGSGGVSTVGGTSGGSGGAVYSAPSYGLKEWRLGLFNFLSRLWVNPSAYIMNAPGTGGGGGGGGSGQSGSGGGGGGGANTGIVLFANKIITSGANEFYFIGGNGGAGGNAINNNVGSGGGGSGGQGGFVYIVTNGVSGSFSGSAINVSGGNGGAAGTGGGGTLATAGRGGSSGTVVITKLDKGTTTIYLPASTGGPIGAAYSYPIL